MSESEQIFDRYKCRNRRGLSLSLPLYLSVSPYVILIDRTDRPDAISSSRDRLSRTSSPMNDVLAKAHAFLSDQSSFFLSLVFVLSHAALAGGRRRQKLRNEAPKLPKWPCAMQARRSDRSSGLFLCACLVTVMDCVVGMMQKDAQAPRTRSCVRVARTTCATSREDPWDSGVALYS